MLREINGTGIGVAAIGLGAMPLSIQGRPDEHQALEVIRTFIEAGGNFIDTANVYCLDDTDIGHSERLIAKALEQLDKVGQVVVATKGGLRRPNGEWVVDGDPRRLRRACEKSLQDLNTDCITLYQLHAVDPNVGLLPSLNELVRLRQEGKILHIGLSNVSPELLRAAVDRTTIVSVQNRCSAFDKQDLRNGLIDYCRTQGITYIPYSPVGGHYGHLRLGQSELFGRLEKNYGVSRYRIALAWLLAKGEHILPIPGASKPGSVADSVTAPQVTLAPEDILAIDQLPEFP